MFTGIIQTLGKIVGLKKVTGSARSGLSLTIQSPWRSLTLGESIAVDGVCLTVLKKKSGTFTVETAQETLNKTTLGQLKAGSLVNLERALRLSDRLGGHCVQGHVDAVGRIQKVQSAGNSKIFWFTYPPSLAPYLVPKGSVAVDGISLTIVEVTSKSFSCAVLDYTRTHTSLKAKKINDAVNLETDIFAKIIAKQVQYYKKAW